MGKGISRKTDIKRGLVKGAWKKKARPQEERGRISEEKARPQEERGRISEEKARLQEERGRTSELSNFWLHFYVFLKMVFFQTLANFDKGIIDRHKK